MKDTSTHASIDIRVGVISIPRLPIVKEVIEDGIKLDIHMPDDICLLSNPEPFEFV